MITDNMGQRLRAFGALPTYGAGHWIPACPHWAMGKETLGQAVTARAGAASPQLRMKPGRTKTSWKQEETLNFRRRL